MLKIFRKNTVTRNIILGFIIIALASYVLVSFGQAPPLAQGSTLAELGGTKLKYSDLKIMQRTYNNQFANANFQPEQINQFVVSALMNEAIIKNGAQDLDITVSDAELRDYVIRFRKNFDADGKFLTEEQWANWIRYNYQMPVATFEEYLREKDLLVNKFRNQFFMAPVVTDAEVKEAFDSDNTQLNLEYTAVYGSRLRGQLDLSDDRIKEVFDNQNDQFMTGERRKIEYVYLESTAFEDPDGVTDAEIETFFEENKDKPPYHIDAKSRVSHILLKLDGRDEKEAREKLLEIKKEIEGGTSFEDAASQHSEDAGTKTRGGDLSLRSRAQWQNRFKNDDIADLLMNLEEGAVSDPMVSNDGVHLFTVTDQREEVKQTLEEAKQQIQQKLAIDKSRDIAKSKADSFLAEIKTGKDFMEVAKSMEIEVHTSPFFDDDPQNELGEPLGRNPNTIRQVFQLLNLNETTEVLNAMRGFVVAKWTETGDPVAMEWEKDQARIKTEAEKLLADQFLNSWVEEAQKDPKPLKDSLKDAEFITQGSILETGLFSKESLPQNLRIKDLDFDQLYQYEKGSILPPLKGTTDTIHYLVRIEDKTSPDPDAFEEAKSDIVARLKQEKATQMLSEYAFHKRKTLDPGNQVEQLLLGILNSNQQ